MKKLAGFIFLLFSTAANADFNNWDFELVKPSNPNEPVNWHLDVSPNIAGTVNMSQICIPNKYWILCEKKSVVINRTDSAVTGRAVLLPGPKFRVAVNPGSVYCFTAFLRSNRRFPIGVIEYGVNGAKLREIIKPVLTKSDNTYYTLAPVCHAIQNGVRKLDVGVFLTSTGRVELAFQHLLPN